MLPEDDARFVAAGWSGAMVIGGGTSRGGSEGPTLATGGGPKPVGVAAAGIIGGIGTGLLPDRQDK